MLRVSLPLLIAATFLASALMAHGAQPAPWPDYQIIMWQRQTPAAYSALKRIGITAGMVETDRATGLVREDQLNRVKAARFGFYLENIATDFYSPYHRFYEGKPVNWRYLDLKDRYRRDRSDRGVFVRNPSLSDPTWLAKIGNRLAANVRALGPDRPLFYNLADEPGIADLATNWDFDFSSASLDAMRQWLRGQYGSLAALNFEWDTRFGAWGDVVPETTDEAMKGRHDNFAPWLDFKSWMDVAFARAIASGTTALHAADPAARSAIEGGQIPGGGGWDYSLLAGTTDVMELYDYGDNVEIMRSLAPHTVLLTTSFGGGQVEEHRVWRELLRGTRGLVLWDSAHDFIGADDTLGPRGLAAAPYFRELRGGVGALIIASERTVQPVAILYSERSQHLEWILDRLSSGGNFVDRLRGRNWLDRNSSDEYSDTAIRSGIRTTLRTLEHRGIEPVFVTPEELVNDSLHGEGIRVLVLPHSIALAPAEVAAIRAFASRGGTVVSDPAPGLFDEHGRRRPKPPLVNLLKGEPKTISPNTLLTQVSAAGITAGFPVLLAGGEAASDVESYVFSNGSATILALLRDLPASGVPASGEELVSVSLPHSLYAYDVRAGRALGRRQRLTLPLSQFAPTILAISDQALPEPTLHGPMQLRRSDAAIFHITAATTHDVIHLEVTDPSGRLVERYARNVLIANAAADFALTFGDNDPPGLWTLTVRDLITGARLRLQTELSNR